MGERGSFPEALRSPALGVLELTIQPAIDELRRIGNLAAEGEAPSSVFARYMDVYVALYSAGKLAENVLAQITAAVPKDVVAGVAKAMTSAVDAKMKELSDALFAVG